MRMGSTPLKTRFRRNCSARTDVALSSYQTSGKPLPIWQTRKGALIDSQYDRAPPTRALYRSVDSHTLTIAEMRAITRDVAVAIGVKRDYHMPNLKLFL
jgi:hypothetical protein